MSDLDALDERLGAVERALTDGDRDLTDLRNASEVASELDDLGERLDDAEARLDELEAATQALRGYVGNVRAVNESVERRADAALAKAESLEAAAVDRGENGGDSTPVTCGCRACGPDSSPDRDDDDEERADADEPPSDESGLLASIAEAL